VAARRLFSDVEPIASAVLPGLHLRPFDIFGCGQRVAAGRCCDSAQRPAGWN
jgi:hypothetical protein